MAYRLTKIYTRKGDEGYTQLNDRPVSKDDLLIEALGTLDELNSMLGLVYSLGNLEPVVQTCITEVQNDLFEIGSEFHVPERVTINAAKVTQLEQQLDAWNQTLPPLKEFLLPRGNAASAACHVARTVCRRAERAVVRLHRQVPLHNPEILRYLNRLSDLLFVMARIIAHETNEPEAMWEHK